MSSSVFTQDITEREIRGEMKVKKTTELEFREGNESKEDIA